jgi:hypothetical protein
MSSGTTHLRFLAVIASRLQAYAAITPIYPFRLKSSCGDLNDTTRRLRISCHKAAKLGGGGELFNKTFCYAFVQFANKGLIFAYCVPVGTVAETVGHTACCRIGRLGRLESHSTKGSAQSLIRRNLGRIGRRQCFSYLAAHFLDLIAAAIGA